MEITTIKSGNIKASLTNAAWWEDIIGKEPNEVKTVTSAYSYVPLVYRAVNLRANAVSSPEFVVTKKDGNDKVEWPFETYAQDMIWRIEASLCLAGFSCWTPVKQGQQTIDWEELNPFDIEIKVEKSNIDGTVILFKQKSTGETWINKPRRNYYEMFYISEYNPQSMYLPGKSKADVVLGDAGLLQYLQVFSSKFFEGGAINVTLLGMENVSDDEIKRTENFFKRAATGIGNAFRILGVRAGAIQPTSLTQPIKDLVIPELHKQARQNVAVGFEIPHNMLEDADSLASGVEQHQGFYEDTIKPRGRKIVNEINKQMLDRAGIVGYQDFNKLSIFQEDEAERAASLSNHYAVTGDILLSYELAGYELTDEQKARLEKLTETEPEVQQEPETQTENKPDEQEEDEQDQTDEDMKRWKKKAIERVKKGKPALCEFDSEHITAKDRERIEHGLKQALTVSDVVAVFEVPQDEAGIAEKLEKLINGLYLLTEGTNEPV